MTSTTRPTRRTDEIRQRRTERVRRVEHPVNRRTARGTAKDPPVMVRSNTASLPLRGGKHSKKTRRRYDVALSVPGAEIRLPSVPHVRMGWRLISAVLVASLSFLLYHAWNSPAFRVETAEISGLQRLTTRDIESVLDVSGEPVFALHPGQIREDIQQAFPEFSAVSVQVGLPNSVVITVTERIPVLTWYQDERTELVDADGLSFPQREGGQAGPSPLVEALGAPAPLEQAALESETVDPAAPGLLPAAADEKPAGPASRQLLKPDMVAGILAMAEQAPEGRPLMYDPLHGLGWRDPHGWEVYFGNVQDIQMKLSVYQALVERFQMEGIQPALVSVEYVHAPYYRLER